MSNHDDDLALQALLTKAHIDRLQVKADWHHLKQGLTPEAIKANVVNTGANAFADMMPKANSVFHYLQKYPGLSLGIAKTLLRLTKVDNAIIRTVGLGVASWFIYNRFKK